jgi:hypothetical protein
MRFSSTIKAWHSSVVAAAIGLLALPASASFSIYTDQASFLAATGPVQTTTFNTYTADLSAHNLNFGAFTSHGNISLDAPSQSYTFDGSTNLFVDTTYGGWSDLRFDQPIVAFGAWFTGINPINRPYSKINVDADSLSGYGSYSQIGSYLPPTTSGGVAQFIGFTSSQAFNRIIFSGAGCCYSSFAVDNVVHAAALAPVPEPETYAMLLAGVGLLAGLTRRRKTRYKA